MILCDLLFHICKCSVVLNCWFELKSLGLIDLSCTNAEVRNDWLDTLKCIRLFGDGNKHLCSLKSVRFLEVFHRWVFERQITQIFADLFFGNYFGKETFSVEKLVFTQTEISDNDTSADSFADDCTDNFLFCGHDNNFTNERIITELLKRSCTSLHTELTFLAESALRLSKKMELCVQTASQSDVLMYNMTTTEMCAIAVQASQMSSLAASRFSQYINKLLISTFADEQHPALQNLISAGSSYSSPYVGVGAIEKWTATEDNKLRTLCCNGPKSNYDLLTITAHMNLRLV